MALRLFADHCVSNLITESLAAAGHEVLRLKDHLPTESPDYAVIAKAQELDAILLSLNGDFGDIVSYPPSRFKGIVALQILNHPEITYLLLERLRRYFELHPLMEEYRGKLITVDASRIRVRQ
jgi:predicted nuclease of predicted toxin-antitoxin system